MKPTITIGHFPTVDHLVLGVTAKNDAPDFSHSSLKTRMFENWDKMAEALVAKRLDGAFILFPLAMELFRKGAPIKLVLLGQREGQVLVVQNDIKKVSDLKGKTVLTPHKFSVHTILLHQILKGARLDPLRDVKRELGFENVRDMPELLQKDKIQAFISAEPWATIAKQTGIGKMMAVSHDVKSHHVCCVLVLQDELIEQHPEACQELVDSLVRSGMFINAYPRQSAEIGEVFLKSPKKIILESLTHDRGHILLWDLLPRVDDFEELERIAIDEMGLWKKSINLEKLVYPIFAQQAYREWMIDTRRTVRDRGEERTLPGNFKEAATRFRLAVSPPARIAGVSTIRKGKAFPSGIVRKKVSNKITPEFVGEILLGKALCIDVSGGDAKGLCYFPPEAQTEPDRVIVELNRDQFEACRRAVHFGASVESSKTTAHDLLFSDREAFIPSDSGKIWYAMSFLQFRFLVLLLSQTNKKS